MTATTGSDGEYEALSCRAGLADLTGRTLIEVAGADCVTFLHSFCTNDVKRLATGEGCEAFVTNPQGKTIGHGYVFQFGDRLLLDTVAGQAGVLIPHFDKYVISEDVTFRDLTAACCELLLAGPNAAAILRQVSDGEPPAGSPGCAERQIAGQPVAVKRLEYAGPESYFIQAARDVAAVVRSTLLAAGAETCGPEAAEARRIERGVPLFGVDIADDNLPQEIGRDAQAISFRKGCYLGQETVARIDALGHVNRLLAGLQIDGPAPPRGSELIAEGKVAGQITSAAYSPKLRAVLALGLVRRAQAKAGMRLACGSIAATVVKLPL